MKKFLFILAASLLVVMGCSNESAAPNKEEAKPKDETPNAEVEVEETSKTTTDPLEFGNKNEDYETLEYEYDTYKLIERYANDETDENGFNHIDFNGYEFTFSMLAVEDEAGVPYIAVVGETENKTDDTVQFNADVEFVTDTQDQTNNEDGIGDSKPGVKLKGLVLAPLNYGVPNSFTVTIDAPFKETGDYEYEEGHYGEAVELEFNKE